MNKITKFLVVGLTAAMLLSGCFSRTGSSDTATENESDYGNIKTIESPAGFTGNTGDVTIESGDTYAVITIQDFGEITVKLFPEAAHEGVQNFIDVANSGYYNGKEIHRVISDYLIQGGSPNGDGVPTGDEYEFGVEYNANMRHYYGALCYTNNNSININQFYIVSKKSYDSLSELDSYEEELNKYLESMDEEISLSKEALAAAVKEEDRAHFENEIELYTAWKNQCKSQLRAYHELTEEMETKYFEVGGISYLDGWYTVFGQTVDGFDVIDAISEVEVEELPTYNNELSHPIQPIIIQSVEIFTA